MGTANSKAPSVDVLDRVVAQSDKFPWSINNGTLANGNQCSIFVHKKNGPGSLASCQQLVKNLKLCRHPYLLHYYESQEDADAVYLVTEPVVPLNTVLHDMSEMDIALGAHILATSLTFLHTNALMSHNHIRLSSIFVNQADHIWRLGGMEYVCKSDSLTAGLVGDVVRAATPESPAPPEDMDGTFLSNQIHCRDSWMLGHLVLSLMDKFTGKADGELMKFKQTVRKFYCCADPRKRPSTEQFLNCQYFKSYPQHALIYSVEFLESITIKSEEEKRAYFRKASTDLFKVTSELFQRYLMRLMFSDIIFADENAREYLLPRLLTVKTKRESRGFYKAESYAKIMAPLLRDLYKRRAKHTRLVLLRLARWYVPFLPTHFVRDYLLPEILLGLNDTDDAVVMATFTALSVLTSFLGATTVVGSSLQKSHFHDAFPRGAGEKLGRPEPELNEQTFAQTMNGTIMNESDIDSGKEYPMLHVSRQEMLRNERERRAEDCKRKRAREARKRKEQEPVKLIEVASAAPTTSHSRQDGASQLTNHSILKKERFVHPGPLLIHEQQGVSMEYRPDPVSETVQWDSESNLDLPSEEEEEDPAPSLLQLARQSTGEEEEGTLPQDGSGVEEEDGSGVTPVNIDSKANSEENEVISPATLEVTSQVSRSQEDGFSRWEDGGWSDFDSQFESDDGIELRNLNKEISQIVPPGTIHEVATMVPATVADVMNLDRGVQIQPESEPDIFADMKPSYMAPKLL